MSAHATVQEIASREYPYGFVTDLEADTAPRGLNEDVIRMISAKKNEPSSLGEQERLTGVAVDAMVDPCRLERRSRRSSPRSASSSVRSRRPYRAIRQEDAVSMIVNGFCREVLKELPMELAVEAQKLLGVSLEGCVG